LPNIFHNDEARAADLDLVRAVARGDESSLSGLYDRYGGLVYSVAYRVLRDAGAAEEVLQDVFYQLWCNASNYDASRGKLTSWLLVSARNRAIDKLRRRQPDAPAHGKIVPMAVNLETSVAQTELISRIRAACEALPPPQRQTLELAYFEGMTHSEISARTGEPLGTVKTRLRAALQTLRQVLNP
jgi:RNA polymerase sigma-70 factor (ECF subfamily)